MQKWNSNIIHRKYSEKISSTVRRQSLMYAYKNEFLKTKQQQQSSEKIWRTMPSGTASYKMLKLSWKVLGLRMKQVKFSYLEIWQCYSHKKLMWKLKYTHCCILGWWFYIASQAFCSCDIPTLEANTSWVVPLISYSFNKAK